ncbi:MAG: ADP-forming succinate--CoA ligase subunit beta [Alphaproteobacteria bacterium]|nr:ADP-forming succinate--CoA ligase subunit beta [Alphaproteobacteria bacterium]
MNIHEYQAKQILNNCGVKVPAGCIAYTPSEAVASARKVSQRGPWVLKAQIQSGARQQGYFLGDKSGLGGIRVVNSLRRIKKEALAMLGQRLVTIQTGPAGKTVNKIYVEAFQKVKRVFYMALTVNSLDAAITLLVADVRDGDILKLALNNPEEILHLPLDLNNSVSQEQLQTIMSFLHLPQRCFNNLENLVRGLQKTFLDLDASMIEINPVGLAPYGELWALDAKISFDDNALFRHPDIMRLKDECEFDPRELAAQRFKFTYHEFNGAVGCIVNGDGLALSAIDLLKDNSSGAACFINVKGGVDKDKIAQGIKLIMTNPRVEGILLNILGGFVRCNLIADGIVAAAAEVGLNVPFVVRFEGTNKDMAREILENSHLPVIWADNLSDGVNKLLQAIREAV